MPSSNLTVVGRVGAGLLLLAACNRPGAPGATVAPVGDDRAAAGEGGAEAGSAPASAGRAAASGGAPGKKNGGDRDGAAATEGEGDEAEGRAGTDDAGGEGGQAEPPAGQSGEVGSAGRRNDGGSGSESASGRGGSAAGRGGSSAGGAPLGGTSSGGAASGGTPGGESPGGVTSAGATGGSDNAGGAPAGGAGGTSGTAGAGGGTPCTFDVTSSTSPTIPSVGIVEWSTSLADLTSARIVYTLDDADSSVLNRGGTAPVDVSDRAAVSRRTLLLGLKPARNYHFHVEADATGGASCRSEDFSLSTGTLSNIPAITRTVADSTAQLPGFIVTCGGFGSTAPVVIIDADGAVVWSAEGPTSASRARLDYEGKNLWVLAANAQNGGGDLRSVSMDGLTTQANLSGLERAHHDFVALEGGRIATLAWSKSGLDPESDLLERSPDGTIRTIFHVGPNLYLAGPSAFGGSQKSYHANSVTHDPSDGSFTIGDRNPSLFVKVSNAGSVAWQFGGSCTSAPAPLCVPGAWQINHGHQLLHDGTFLFFNNTGMGKTTPSSFMEFKLDTSASMSGAPVTQWTGKASEHSDTLGDVQRLPNGNTLVTFSNNGTIYELDPASNVVQTLKATSFGYSEWRPTLYGPPTR